MGKNKGFNWRARQVVTTEIDNSKTEKIKIEIDGSKSNSYDECNTLVLPSEKRKTKIKNKKVKVTKILSKSQRKKLEKVVERRKKKENRSALLEALSKVQATPDELKQFTSISAIQTKGLKKHLREVKYGKIVRNDNLITDKEVKVNSIAGSHKRKNLDLLKNSKKNKTEIDNPNVIGFDDESIDSDLSESATESSKDEIKSEPIQITEISNVSDSTVPIEVIDDDYRNSVKVEPIIKEAHSLSKLTVKKDVIRKPAVFVDVLRTVEIETARLKLPILAEEQMIMETINENQVIILAGETGSGKTTQVPQFLYEAGYAQDKIIGITEPRRVAAISMSKRVAEEMNLSSKEVSYLIRFEGNVTEDTKIKFMTDGVLLKEIQSDFLLSKYSVVIIDEAHERSVYTDILIGLLSRIVPLRHKRGIPLKLIIMSATLRLEDFTENNRVFKIKPPVIKVDSRQFPVTIHFNRHTSDDYVNEAYRKAIKIHTQLPEGGILIFLTGQREVNTLVQKLRHAFPFRSNVKKDHKNKNLEHRAQPTKTESEDSDIEKGLNESLNHVKRKRKKNERKLPDINLDDYSVPVENDLDSISGSEFDEEIIEDNCINLVELKNAQPLWTLPLYSLLPSYKQSKVFENPPEGCRLCVVSTNVAETSLTIPNIKYVVDSGRAKVRLYDKITGVSAYEVTWTSKAAANQRAGRAGRISAGHCYRLYSSAIFNDIFKEYSIPEIQQKPVDDLYLQMKCMNIDKVINFPFPSAPDLMQLKTAEIRLISLGALEEIKNKDCSTKVTPLGYAISKFPVLPRYGKMLALSHQQNLLQYTICMVAALSIQEILLEIPIFETNEVDRKMISQKWVQTRRSWAGVGNSLLLGDPMVLLRAVGAAEFANVSGLLEKFCKDNGLRHKAVIEIRKLRLQLTNEIKANLADVDINVDPKMPPPTDIQAKLLRQILLSGMGDQVAKKVDLEDLKEDQDKAKWKHAYQRSDMEDPIFMHSSSVLRKKSPEWVVYQEIYETNKMYMRGVTAIEPEWLPKYVPKLCNLSEPLLDPEPRYDSDTGKLYCTVSGTFGKQGWALPNCEILFPDCLHKYKWFARFFLEGKVFHKLEKFKTSLLSSPSIMIKSWANLQPRTEILLKCFLSKQINSRDDLTEIWKEDSNYLLSAYQKWVPESAYNEVALLWPPLN